MGASRWAVCIQRRPLCPPSARVQGWKLLGNTDSPCPMSGGPSVGFMLSRSPGRPGRGDVAAHPWPKASKRGSFYFGLLALPAFAKLARAGAAGDGLPSTARLAKTAGTRHRCLSPRSSRMKAGRQDDCGMACLPGPWGPWQAGRPPVAAQASDSFAAIHTRSRFRVRVAPTIRPTARLCRAALLSRPPAKARLKENNVSAGRRLSHGLPFLARLSMPIEPVKTASVPGRAEEHLGAFPTQRSSTASAL